MSHYNNNPIQCGDIMNKAITSYLEQNRFTIVLVCLMGVLLIYPFVENYQPGHTILNILITIVLIARLVALHIHHSTSKT